MENTLFEALEILFEKKDLPARLYEIGAVRDFMRPDNFQPYSFRPNLDMHARAECLLKVLSTTCSAVMDLVRRDLLDEEAINHIAVYATESVIQAHVTCKGTVDEVAELAIALNAAVEFWPGEDGEHSLYFMHQGIGFEFELV